MTEDRLALFELIDQSADNDLVRDMLAFAAGRIMEMEVEAHTGAAPVPAPRIARPAGMATGSERGVRRNRNRTGDCPESCARGVFS